MVRGWRGTKRLGDGGGFVLDAQAGLFRCRLDVDVPRRAAGQSSQGSSGGITDQLVPDFSTDFRRRLTADAPGGDQTGQRLHPFRERAVRFAENEAAFWL